MVMEELLRQRVHLEDERRSMKKAADHASRLAADAQRQGRLLAHTFTINAQLKSGLTEVYIV